MRRKKLQGKLKRLQIVERLEQLDSTHILISWCSTLKFLKQPLILNTDSWQARAWMQDLKDACGEVLKAKKFKRKGAPLMDRCFRVGEFMSFVGQEEVNLGEKVALWIPWTRFRPMSMRWSMQWRLMKELQRVQPQFYQKLGTYPWLLTPLLGCSRGFSARCGRNQWTYETPPCSTRSNLGCIAKDRHSH